MTQLTQVRSPQQIPIVRELLREYQRQLGVDLCFQGFETELQELPGKYAPPSGRLVLALSTGTPVGCIGLQRIDARRGEIKRLYVRDSARGLGVGRMLVEHVLSEARAIGYAEVVLDTLPSMATAQRLYEQFGFRDIDPYRPNPIVGTRYLGKNL